MPNNQESSKEISLTMLLCIMAVLMAFAFAFPLFVSTDRSILEKTRPNTYQLLMACTHFKFHQLPIRISFKKDENERLARAKNEQEQNEEFRKHIRDKGLFFGLEREGKLPKEPKVLVVERYASNVDDDGKVWTVRDVEQLKRLADRFVAPQPGSANVVVFIYRDSIIRGNSYSQRGGTVYSGYIYQYLDRVAIINKSTETVIAETIIFGGEPKPDRSGWRRSGSSPVGTDEWLAKFFDENNLNENTDKLKL